LRHERALHLLVISAKQGLKILVSNIEKLALLCHWRSAVILQLYFEPPDNLI